ncbi:MAG: glycoside hydrolase family 88 protein [Caldilineaceae bacterium]
MKIDQHVTALAAQASDLWQLDGCGVTRALRVIPLLLHHSAWVADADTAAAQTQVLLVGGLSGTAADVALALQALAAYREDAAQVQPQLALSAVPCANPDGLAQSVAPENGVGGVPAEGYPPVDNFYHDATNPEARYLWRWICYQAPDLVLEVCAGEQPHWEASEPFVRAFPQAAATLRPAFLTPSDSLLGALARTAPDHLAPLACLRLFCPPEALPDTLYKLWPLLAQATPHQLGGARQVLMERQARPPLTIGHRLAAVYGYQLDPVVYTQGVAISGRLRLAQLDGQSPDPTPGIADLVEPYLSGAKPLFPGQAGGANLAGLVWADELAAATGDQRYAKLLVETADRYRTAHANGVPTPSDPDYRVEDMFFSATMLGRAFKLTGDATYLPILTRFLLEANVQQADGLCWHDRSTPFYWGRGNGFAALGFAEALTYLPESHPDRAALLAIHRNHLAALLRHQHASGLWRQVVDFPGSYLELSATCMIGYALARGLRLGWLDATFQAALGQAWRGVAARIDDQGGLVDVCTGTGVQKTLRAYLDRPAIFGRDERGGALALWFAVEMAQYISENGFFTK